MLGPQDLWIALALGVFFFGQAVSEFKKGVASGAPEEPAPPKEPTA